MEGSLHRNMHMLEDLVELLMYWLESYVTFQLKEPMLILTLCRIVYLQI